MLSSKVAMLSSKVAMLSSKVAMLKPFMPGWQALRQIDAAKHVFYQPVLKKTI